MFPGHLCEHFLSREDFVQYHGQRVHVSEVSSDHSEFRFHPWIHAVIWDSNFYKSGYLQFFKHSDDGSNGEPHQGASGIGPKESCIGEHLRQ